MTTCYDSPHDKGRSCERTEAVLDNYRQRALAAEKRLTPPRPGLELVIFWWSREKGDCFDCGLPAAFEADLYRVATRSQQPDDWEQLCAVCAANHAAAGCRVRRIKE